MAGGYRSFEGVWIGGVSAESIAPSAGYISYEAFWLGGASAVISPVPPAPTPAPTVEARRWPGPSIILYDELAERKKIIRRQKDNEEIIIL